MRQPDQVLAKLNDAFPSARHGQKFFTAWYGVYKRSTGLLTWSGGGHHPSILLAPGARDPILLPSSGMIIGFMSGQEYPAESREVAAGARLLIFSAGFSRFSAMGSLSGTWKHVSNTWQGGIRAEEPSWMNYLLMFSGTNAWKLEFLKCRAWSKGRVQWNCVRVS